MSTIDILRIRKRLGRDYWGMPIEFGLAGWRLDSMVGFGRIIITNSQLPQIPGAGDDEWVHASISWRDHMPTYDELDKLHKAVWPNGYAYQVFAPPSQHVNLHSFALHLWGRPDGSPILPEFGALGTI